MGLVIHITISIKNARHTLDCFNINCLTVCNSPMNRSAFGAKRTIKDVINRFVDEIAPTMLSLSVTNKRLRSLERDCGFVGDPLDQLTTESITAWRDERLKRLTAAGAMHELDFLTALLEIARFEWGWTQDNPALSVERTCQYGRNRSRRVSDIEAQTISAALGYNPGVMAGSAPAFTALAFLLSLETGLRKHEIKELRWSDVFLDKDYLQITANAERRGRTVPLFMEAKHLLDQLYRFEDDDRCIPIRGHHASISWVKAREIAAEKLPSLADLAFNDARYEGIARLAKKFGLLALSRIADHEDLATLAIFYLNTPAETSSAHEALAPEPQ
jgi:integrase